MSARVVHGVLAMEPASLAQPVLAWDARLPGMAFSRDCLRLPSLLTAPRLLTRCCESRDCQGAPSICSCNALPEGGGSRAPAALTPPCQLRGVLG